MWLLLAFCSAALLGCYDVCKKQALRNNAVVPVLTLNTLFCTLIFMPCVVASRMGMFDVGHLLYVPHCSLREHAFIVLKAVIVLSSWLCGYLGIKHLPLTIVGPINATRPVMVLVGALLVFGEHLNLYQWMGVTLAVVSFFMLSRSGRREGIDFRHNRWIALVVLAAALGAVSGLYDKHIMAPVGEGGVGLNRMAVQSYYNAYQFVLMAAVMLVMRRVQARRVRQAAAQGAPLPAATAFRWHWAIPLISVFLSVADFAYFYALSLPGALISVVSMVRRSSVLVSFTVGAIIFHEKNLRAKAFDLFLVMLGMLFLYLGSR